MGLLFFFLFIFSIWLLNEFLEKTLKVENPLIYPVFIIIFGAMVYGVLLLAGGDSSCQGFGPGTWCE